MFNGDKIVLDEEILNIREGKELEKSEAKEKVIKNAIEKYNTRLDVYKKLIASNVEESKYNAKQKKAIVSLKKLKSDAAVPSLAADIRIRYNGTKHRTIMTICQYLTNCGYCIVRGEFIDIVDRILAMESICQVRVEGDAMNAPEYQAPDYEAV